MSHKKLKVLCSPASLEEARLLVDLGVDIIDVKNPAEGSLGAQPPWVVREIAEYVRSRGPAVSAALGDLPFKPGTAALAAYGMAQLGVEYIKVGMHGTQSYEQAVELLAAVRQAIDMVDQSIALVAAGYADHELVGSLDPIDLVLAASHANCRIVMLDTAYKNRGSIFDLKDEQSLQAFVQCAHEADLIVALAGSISGKHLPELRRIA